MARISKKNPRYRTHRQMAEDVSFALRSHREHKLSYGGQFSVIRAVLSAWTESEGKYRGCRYWSKLAIGLYLLHRDERRLCHEHVVPKILLIRMLASLLDPTPDAVEAILSRHLIGAVITREEDNILSVEYRKTMPDDFKTNTDPLNWDPWLRYKKHPSIEIVDMANVAPESEAVRACGWPGV